jgi:hypothetical protein
MLCNPLDPRRPTADSLSAALRIFSGWTFPLREAPANPARAVLLACAKTFRPSAYHPVRRPASAEPLQLISAASQVLPPGRMKEGRQPAPEWRRPGFVRMNVSPSEEARGSLRSVAGPGARHPPRKAFTSKRLGIPRQPDVPARPTGRSASGSSRLWGSEG